MPKMSGLEVARALSKEKESPAIVLLTMFDDEEMLNEAMDLGVKAYLLKESASVDVSNAVHAAIEGRHFISPSLTDKLLLRSKKRQEFSSGHPGIETLSPTERKVLKLISESKTSKEIADTMFLSQKTVDNYRFKISEKLNLHGSYSLLKFALEHKPLL
jgi:DNA-binding NarL/FixJ family response regulator